MKLIILAAGRGSRLKNLTSEIPKCMVEFEAKPIISWQLEKITKVIPASQIAIVTGYKNDILVNFINNLYPEITTINNDRWIETNMVSSLIAAQNWIDSDIIISYSDIIYDESILKKIIDLKPHNIVIPSNTKWQNLWETRFENPLDDLETFVTHNDKLLEIGKKPESYDQIQGQFMGIAYFPNNLWQQVLKLLLSKGESVTDKLDFTSMINLLINNSYDIKTINHHDYWIEIDNQNDIECYSKTNNLFSLKLNT